MGFRMRSTMDGGTVRGAGGSVGVAGGQNEANTMGTDQWMKRRSIAAVK